VTADETRISNPATHGTATPWRSNPDWSAWLKTGTVLWAARIHVPISFKPDEGQEALLLEEAQRDADAQVEEYRIMFGIGPDGWVPSERYEELKEAMSTLKASMIDSAESELDRNRIREHWIYDDMDEDEYR
jgi:hypothetical protein